MSARHANAYPAPEVQRLRKAMVAEPATKRTEVRPVRVLAATKVHYAVFLGGQRLSRAFSQRGNALDHASSLQTRIDELRGQERLCITCRAPFLSAGPHNRMCDHCRAHCDDLGM